MKKARIHYFALDEDWRKAEKLAWFRDNKLESLDFQLVTPDKNNNWINLSDNDWDTLMPIADKDLKQGKKKDGAIFELFSLGVVTARDEWVYDFDEQNLEKKVRYLIEVYNRDVEKLKGLTKDQARHLLDTEIKWTRAVKNDLNKGKNYAFSQPLIVDCNYRPFIQKKLYFSKALNEMQYQLSHVFGKTNLSINFLCVDSNNQLTVLISDKIFDYCQLKMGNGGTQCLPLYRYLPNGERVDNITDWALAQFQGRYTDISISKPDIFHYCYAVLHHPAYRKKYELNLRREFPRLPLYDDFRQWAAWGKELLDLHLGYEQAAPWPLTRHEQESPATAPALFAEAPAPAPVRKVKVKLKADRELGTITIDEQTLLSGIPPAAWAYKLGNRSALDWVLDQYKEKKPGDPTIAEQFNTYRFADYKEQVIDLLARVCRVSVETMRVVGDMGK